MTATSRGNYSVIKCLAAYHTVDLFLQNLQNESAYDIAAENADPLACQLIESYERLQWSTVRGTGLFF